MIFTMDKEADMCLLENESINDERWNYGYLFKTRNRMGL